ncbi:MAG: M28 family peptidase [Defluviitaleaceae bacterium]|nr:M28 family peptidase [Defluviitaleaceae bacterium]
MTNGKLKPIFSFLIITVSLTIGAILGFWQIQPPSVDRSSPNYPVFQRMMGNIERWTQTPRPIGSKELESVRTEIVAEIENMGFSPIIHNVESINIQMNNTDIDVKNILVKFEHPDAARGVLFMAHYDSVGNSAGAGDNMVSVAALLEGLRSLEQVSDLKNNIYILFTDSEEFGLIGSRGFVNEHPELLEKIDMIVNIDGTSSGGVILFERTPLSYSLVRFYKNASVRPIGFSLASFIYDMMPMASDLMPFERAGLNGFSISAMEGMNTWHTPMDSFENLNEATAWHYLLNTLALVDYVANNSLDVLDATPKEAVFFPFFPSVMILMTAFVSAIFGIAACVLAVVALVYKLKQKSFKISFSNVCLLLFLILTIASMIFLATGSYLFYIPLFLTATCILVKKWSAGSITYVAIRGLSYIIVMMLWFPVIYLLVRILFGI